MADPTLGQPRRVNTFSTRVLNVLSLFAVLAGLLAAALNLGYYHPRLPRTFLGIVELVAVVALLLEIPLRALLLWNVHAFLARHWPEILLSLILLPPTNAGESSWKGWLNPGAAFLVGHLLLRFLRAIIFLARQKVSPGRLLVGGFAGLILLGAAGLKLPKAVPLDADKLNITDALFTSTSAACLNGLTIRTIGSDQTAGLPARLVNDDLNPAGFTWFGQAIILVLIQAGGVGLMIFGALFATRMIGPPAPGDAPAPRAGRAIAVVLLVTFVAEAIGTALVYTMVADFGWPAGAKLFFAAFHSVGAFCNAGFSLTGDSFVRYHAYWQIHGVIAPLIVLGGLGAPVLMNVGDCVRARLFSRRDDRPRPQLTLHTRLALWTTAILILVGVTGLMLMESALTERLAPGTHVGSHTPSTAYAERLRELASQPDPHRLRDEPTHVQLADVWFMSVSARTGGYSTIDMNYRGQSLSDGSLLLLILLMIVGGSPASTAGGLKTVTLAVLVLTVGSAVRRRDRVIALGCSLPLEVVRRAGALAACYVGLVLGVTLLLTITEATKNPVNPAFIQLLFEAASGCSGGGLSTNLTEHLTVGGRVGMILAMTVGRLGPLALLYVMAVGQPSAALELPPESVALG